MSNKEIVKQLKESIEYYSKPEEFVNKFLRAIEKWFLDKYDYHVRTLTGVTWFAVEKNLNYYYGNNRFITTDFKMTARILADFCDEFECEFDHTSCDGERYIFSFSDVDTKHAFAR